MGDRQDTNYNRPYLCPIACISLELIEDALSFQLTNLEKCEETYFWNISRYIFVSKQIEKQ